MTSIYFIVCSTVVTSDWNCRGAATHGIYGVHISRDAVNDSSQRSLIKEAHRSFQHAANHVVVQALCSSESHELEEAYRCKREAMREAIPKAMQSTRRFGRVEKASAS